MPLASAQAPQQPAVPAGSLILSKTVPFQVGQPIKLDMVVGGLRVPDLKIDRSEEGSLLDSALPPRGGQSRFSWMRYTLAAENPGTESWTLRARIRLLDKNGAIIDEFEFGGKIRKGRAIPMVDGRIVSL